MDLGSTFVVPAPAPAVFAALLDPEVMRDCIPGCEELERLSQTSYRGRMRSEIAHVRFDAAFSANVVDLDGSTRLHAVLQGEDKKIASSIRIDADLQLVDRGPATNLSYRLELALWGRIGRLGEAIVRRRSAEVQEEFEENFVARVSCRRAPLARRVPSRPRARRGAAGSRDGAPLGASSSLLATAAPSPLMVPLHRPARLEEVFELLGELEDPVVYGGGTAIQILAKQRLLFASDLVSLAGVGGLDALEVTDDTLRIGPMVRLRTIERSPSVAGFAPLLCLACAEVANPRVRNTASIGGNLAHGDYRLDPPVALVVLDAVAELASAEGRRRIRVAEFFSGFEQTALEPGELIVGIEVPRALAGGRVAYEKVSSLAANDWPCASVAVELTGDRAARRVRLGLGALAPTTTVLEVDLGGAGLKAATSVVLDAAEASIDPLPDVRGGVEYKRHLGRVAIADALAAAWEAGGE